MTPEPNTEPSSAGLAAAFSSVASGADSPVSLGDYAAVDAMLRTMLVEVLEVREGRQTGAITEADGYARCVAVMAKNAAILLGKDSSYRPVIGWNQPGGIDAHLVKELNIDEADPERRVIIAQWELAKEICQLVKQEEQGQPQEATRWQMDAAIEQMAKLFLGLPMDKPDPADVQ